MCVIFASYYPLLSAGGHYKLMLLQAHALPVGMAVKGKFRCKNKKIITRNMHTQNIDIVRKFDCPDFMVCTIE